MSVSSQKDTQKEFAIQAKKLNSSQVFNNKDIVNQILDLVEKGGRILDLACGPGILSLPIARKSDRVVAFDLTKEMLEIVKKKATQENLNNIKTVQGNAESLPFEDKSFDCIVTRLSFHHFNDLEKVAKELHRVLKKNGSLIVADIVSSDHSEEAELHNALEKLRDPSHVKMLSKKDFKELFFISNFKIENKISMAIKRELEEWVKLTSQGHLYSSIEVIVKNLIQNNKHTGINLRIEKGCIFFDHQWQIYKLKKSKP